MLGMASLPSLPLPSDCSGAIGLLGEGMILPPTAILLLSAIAGVGGVGGWIVAGRRSHEAQIMGQLAARCGHGQQAKSCQESGVASCRRAVAWSTEHILDGCSEHSCMQRVCGWIGWTFSDGTPMTVIGRESSGRRCCRQEEGRQFSRRYLTSS